MGVNLIESDFHKPMYDSNDKVNTSMWQQQNNAVTYLDDNNDGTTNFARITAVSGSIGAFYSPTAILYPGNSYELSFYVRVPKNVVTEDFGAYGENARKYYPLFTIYQPQKNTTAGERVSSVYQEGQNEYAYSHVAEETITRRTSFSGVWTIGNYAPYTYGGYSSFGKEHYNACKDENGKSVSPNVVYEDWTKVTMTFTAIQDDNNQGPQVVAFATRIEKNVLGLCYDIKDFSLVCTDNGLETKTIMASDFEKDVTASSWYIANDVKSMTEDEGDFARLTVTNNKSAYVRSKTFALTPDKNYKLTYFVRIPKESKNFSTAYSQPIGPDFLLYQINNGKVGETITGSLTDDKLYAHKDFDKRIDMPFVWNVEGYNTHIRSGYSDTGFLTTGAIYQSVKNKDGTFPVLNNVFKEWTKVTLEFKATGVTEGSTDPSVAVLQFRMINAADGLMCDIKDITLTETAPKFTPEPDTTNAVFYEGFENITQADVNALITNCPSWTNFSVVSNDSATGTKSLAVEQGYWQYMFVPVDKSILESGTIYEFTMDWKLDAPNGDIKAYIEKLAFVGYNPSLGEVMENNRYDAKDLSYINNLNGTGDWKKAKIRFKVTDLNSYEQFGIIIKYASSNNTHNLYIDTLMITPTNDQSGVEPLNLKDDDRTDDTIKVLAFGNSFSADATRYIKDIAKADGKDLRVANCSIGGCALEKHYNNMLNGSKDYGFTYYTIAYGSQHISNVSMQQALAATDWDYITIQQVSQHSGRPETFEPYLAELLAYFKAKCPDAKILFHTTWAYSEDCARTDYQAYYQGSQSVMHEAIEDAYLEASARYGYVPLIPTGEAIRIARTTAMGDNFNRDGYHLNDRGRIIAALTWYETFTGNSALDVKVDFKDDKIFNVSYSTVDIEGYDGAELFGTPLGITDEEASIMKNAAHTAATLFKKANETQLAIEAIGEVNKDSGDAIKKANALRTELNDDGLLPNIQTLIDANEAYKEFATDFVAGDIDGDNNVDLMDVNMLAKYLAGWDVTVNEKVLDVKGDSIVNLKDLVLLAQYVAGWDVELS
jgi:hypothetical protein